jgi:dihydropyrimidine dehydrogenase (NAD+) subunit PreT
MKETLEQKLVKKYEIYSEAQALAEADRCLYCFEPPCVKACPTEIDIPMFIKKIAVGDPLSAAKTILSANILGDSCASACPVEVLCAGACVYNDKHEPAIAIGRLQKYATSFALKEPVVNIFPPKKALKPKKVALIGAGPASLAAASLLSLHGHEAVIFEKNPYAGGLNANGIAGYKLDFNASQKEVAWLKGLGFTLKLNSEVVARVAHDNQVSAYQLLTDFDAIFLGFGLSDDKMLLPDGPNIIGACHLIKKIKTDPQFSLEGIKKAHVIGGGNTAIDAAHQLKLLGVKEVSILYRQTRAQMSAYAHEIDSALASGVSLLTDCVMDKPDFLGDVLKGFHLKNGSYLATDLLVMAIGQAGPKAEIAHALGVELNDKGLVKVNKFQTSNPKVFSAGDCVSGGEEVVNAVSEAKMAVANMISYLA